MCPIKSANHSFTNILFNQHRVFLDALSFVTQPSSFSPFSDTGFFSLAEKPKRLQKTVLYSSKVPMNRNGLERKRRVLPKGRKESDNLDDIFPVVDQERKAQNGRVPEVKKGVQFVNKVKDINLIGSVTSLYRLSDVHGPLGTRGKNLARFQKTYHLSNKPTTLLLTDFKRPYLQRVHFKVSNTRKFPLLLGKTKQT